MSIEDQDSAAELRVRNVSICQAHWDALRTAVEKKGMGSLVAPNGEECARKMMAFPRTGALRDFEPLMYSNMMILQRWTSESSVQTRLEGGCPLCIVHQRSELGPDWVEGVTDDALTIARDLGFKGGHT